MGWRKETRKSENNVRNSGRKTKKVELNFTDDGLEDAKNEILNICSNDETKENVIQLIEDLKKELINVDSVETQTSNLKPTVKNQATQVNDADEEDSLDSILNVMKKLDNDDLTILFQNTFHLWCSLYFLQRNTRNGFLYSYKYREICYSANIHETSHVLYYT